MIRLVISVVFLLFFLTDCQNGSMRYQTIAGYAQGTSYHITYSSTSHNNLKPDIDSILTLFDQTFSTYNKGSMISRINANDTSVVVNQWFKTVFDKSVEIWNLTSGAFDITVGPIVNAWGFGTAPKCQHNSAYIDSLMQYVGMDKVKIENGKVVKQLPGIKLDMNALAQGFSVDVVCGYLSKQSIANYLVEIGGEVRGKGRNAKGKPWQVGIDKPIDGNFTPGDDLEAIVELCDRALATSGNYRNYYMEKGEKLSHTINPRTGRPSKNNLLSATAIAHDCMTADAMATAYMVLGIEKSIQLAGSLKNEDVFFVFSDKNGQFDVFYSSGLKPYLSIQHNN